MANRILCIDTALSRCSVALFEEGRCLYAIEDSSSNNTAEVINIQIAEILKITGYDTTTWDAVAISGGPGSYTGLRIGASTAKGICYARDLPLIHIDTTLMMALAAKEHINTTYYLASIDARRNDIFYALYRRSMEEEMPIAFATLDAHIFDLYNNSDTCIIGSGAQKVAAIFNDIKVLEIQPSAKNMGEVAQQKFMSSAFEDVAYYEPKYHKAFYTTYKPKIL